MRLQAFPRLSGEWFHILLAIGLILAAGVVEARGPGNATPASVKGGQTPETKAGSVQFEQQAAALPSPSSGAELARRIEELTVRSGDTLMNLLVKASVPRQDAHEAIVALRDVYDPRSLRPGQMLQVVFEEDTDVNATAGERLAELMLEPDFRRNVVVRRQPEGGYVVDEVEKVITSRMVVSEGRIQTSLFVDTTRQDVPVPIVLELIRAYSFDVDFQRDLQPDDRFRAMYEELADEDGRKVGAGKLLHARLILSGKEYSIYRYATADGVVDYYDANGRSVRKTLLRTPVDGARISSRFGKRHHPVLGYTRMHRGLDFAAPTGTPIYAAGNGVIDYAGRNGNYGIYVRIRHNSEYETAYAHMRSLGKGIRRGGRVEQGEIIGYVGTTGLSTGPHLHYEVHLNGNKVNPLTVRFPAGRVLAGAELKRFKQAAGAIDARYVAISGTTRQASAEACAAPVC
ncbi:MAG: peptidoglycan DD-metalloendopeptidase family protein [Acetobacterales bacterium]